MRETEEHYSLFGKINLCVARGGGALEHAQKIRIMYAIKHNQIETLRDHYNNISGFIAWAKIDAHSLNQIRKKNIAPCYEYEWDEGNIAYIHDIYIAPGFRSKTLGFVRKILKRHKVVFYQRNHKNILRILN